MVAAKSNGTMKLAAHLCGSRVNEVLDGNDTFLSILSKLGFQRVQINATAVNGVDTSRLAECVEPFLSIVNNHTELEFIIQKNDETEPLWKTILESESEFAGGKSGRLPTNMSMLVDESKGTGVTPTSSWPTATGDYNIGYAGGIGPKNITNVLNDVLVAGNGHPIWIDMESSLRSIKDGVDVFDLDKCYEVIEATVNVGGILDHPNFVA